jgi:hypothetical protein
MSYDGQSGPEPSRTPFSIQHPSTEPTASGSRTAPEPFRSDAGESSSGGTLSSSEDGRNRILASLEETVETFREGKASKTSTISSILRILGEVSDVSLSESQKEATFDSYLTEIISIQSVLDSDRSGDHPGGSRVQEQTVNPSGHASGSRRTREPSESSDDDDDDKPSKRQRLVESDMPWFSPPDASSSPVSNPSCEETCRLLRAYNKDISKSKFFVKISPRSPPGIPSSQWERILKGESVDLNQIFSSLHYVIPDEERTGRLGDAEISFGVSEAKKRVSSTADWTAAWIVLIRGLKNPGGFYPGVRRVGVRVQILGPSKNPYPSEGYTGFRGGPIQINTYLITLHL